MFHRLFAQSPAASRALVLGGVAGAAVFASSQQKAQASDALHSPPMPWNHNGWAAAFDTASVRRGLMVYQQVCASCHSMKHIPFRALVGVTHDVDGAKAIAAKADIIDGPNDAGEMFTRPGRLADCFPSPYPNDEAARAANNGALPPDFSLIAQARHGNADYLFALLTGYTEPPAGVSIMKGQYYNAYFPGGAISMPPPIMDGQVDYPDGTPNSASQLAKDVSTFLTWASDPTQDQRKLAGCKAVFAMGACALMTFWYKRFKWNVVKTRKIYWADEVKSAQASAMKQQ